MPTILSHPAVPLGLAGALGPANVSPALVAAAVVASVLPDIDAIGFRLGIPYGHLFGHRGFSHSIAFASLVALLAALAAPSLRTRPGIAFTVVFVSVASHGLLDAMTTGGLGIAFFSPFSNHRYFQPWRPIAVAPLGLSAFFSAWGLRVLASELTYVWVPSILVGILGALLRRFGSGA